MSTKWKVSHHSIKVRSLVFCNNEKILTYFSQNLVNLIRQSSLHRNIASRREKVVYEGFCNLKQWLILRYYTGIRQKRLRKIRYEHNYGLSWRQIKGTKSIIDRQYLHWEYHKHIYKGKALLWLMDGKGKGKT